MASVICLRLGCIGIALLMRPLIEDTVWMCLDCLLGTIREHTMVNFQDDKMRFYLLFSVAYDIIQAV